MNRNLSSLKSFHKRFSEFGSREGIEFEANYAAEETNEIVNVLKKMLRAQDVILKVNMQCIKSAGQADEYRIEPPFKLQGSYRNMNKISGGDSMTTIISEVSDLNLTFKDII